MDRPLPNPGRRWLWLLLLPLIGVLAIVGRWGGVAEERREPVLPMAESKTERQPELPTAPAKEAPVAMPVLDFRAAVPPDIPAGHEGHGPECAACTAERGLAACREDYAQMEYARLLDQLDADGSQASKLLEECRRFAQAVIKDWSPAKSRPEMPADEVVAARRQEILEPVLAGIPHKTSHD